MKFNECFISNQYYCKLRLFEMNCQNKKKTLVLLKLHIFIFSIFPFSVLPYLIFGAFVYSISVFKSALLPVCALADHNIDCSNS